jgi:ADP-dependent NAD(P)H-hydrate dehydratase / NAD(P)H-hydrate epimerase
MIPLFSSKQVRGADQFAVDTLGIPSIVLMENAARSIFRFILTSGYDFQNYSVGIVCGKGNNGGDGFALARHFLINDFNVQIISIASEKDLKGDALTNFNITRKMLKNYPASRMMVYRSLKNLSLLDDCGIIVDAILGTGSKGGLVDPYKSIVEYLNKLNAFKAAVDLPTGLDIETSTGDTIFKADLTVTLAEHKTGLFYGKGYSSSGEIKKGSIGIGGSFFKKLQTNDYLIEPDDAYSGLPEKSRSAHKYSAGKVLVIAGSGQYPGAACYTANSVLRSGAGSCFLAFPKSVKTAAQKKLESSVIFPYNDERKEFLQEQNLNELKDKIKWADVVAIGPGLGREESTQKFVIEFLKSNKHKKVVIDADALYALANKEYKRVDLTDKILTPHHKEFADLVGISVEELEKNILQLGKEFATNSGAFLVLKGAPTIIFDPVGEAFINSTGNPGMAKFGTGDVLTGIIAGFLAQAKEIEEALMSAVYLHSLSADLLIDTKTKYGFTPQDIMEEFPNAIKFIIKSFV